MDEQQLQQQIVQLVQAAMQGNQQAQQQVQQIMQAAQAGDPQAQQIAQMIQAVAQQLQGQQVQAAKFGAKLNYLRQLKGQCPEGYEMQYYKKGGQLCKKCMKKEQGGEVSNQVPANKCGNTIDQFKAKCGKKMKKKANGGDVEMDKCGNKMKKAACGTKTKKVRKGEDGINQLPDNRGTYEYTKVPIRGPYRPMNSTEVILNDGSKIYRDEPIYTYSGNLSEEGGFYGTRSNGTEMTENEAMQRMRESFQPAFKFGIPGYFESRKKNN